MYHIDGYTHTPRVLVTFTCTANDLPALWVAVTKGIRNRREIGEGPKPLTI